jgi:AmiR/NasT family two-component response regulator
VVASALTFLLAARRRELHNLDALAQTVSLVRDLGALVHQLQRERGLSSLFVASLGAQQQAQLSSQQAQSKKAESQLLTRLAGIDLAAAIQGGRARLLNLAALTLHECEQLPELRQQVLALAISADQVAERFSALIATLLSLVFEAADSATDPKLTRVMVSLFFLLQGKELAGQERAAGAAGFALRQFDADRRARLEHLAHSQQRCLEVARERWPCVSDRHWRALAPALDREPVQRLLKVAHQSQLEEALPATLGEVWYQVSTVRIDALKQLEDVLTTELVKVCQALQQELRAEVDDRDRLLERFASRNQNRMPVDWLLPGHSGTEADVEHAGHSTMQAGLDQSLSPVLVEVLHAQTERLQELSQALAEARSALDERKLIERAKGLLMTHRKLTETEAYGQLRASAMQQQKRVVDVARTVISHIERLGRPS